MGIVPTATRSRGTSWVRVRGRLGQATKAGAPPEEIAELRRELKFELLRTHLAEEMDNPPYLTVEQRQAAAEVLLGGERRDV